MHAVIECPRVESFPTSFTSKDSMIMGQQHRPVVRKRSLAELPGHVRVPVFKKPDRLKSRLEASLAGLKELQTLREKHQDMVTQAMTSFKSPLESSATDTKETQPLSSETTESFGQSDGCAEKSSAHNLSQLWRETFGESHIPTDVASPGAETSEVGITTSVDSVSSEHKETEVTLSESKVEDTVVSHLEINSNKDSEVETATANPEDEGKDSSPECSVTSETPKSKPLLRPRSMSLCHVSIAQKFRQENKTKTTGISSTSSADDILSSDSPKSCSLKRKGSIFEGVDISIQGPNPVHAILMQYSPLSSTQSMPSVCTTLPRRHSALLSKSSSGLTTNSETSSSRESVFSRAETATSSTQTEDVAEHTTTHDVGTQLCGMSQNIPQTTGAINERRIGSSEPQPEFKKSDAVQTPLLVKCDLRLSVSQPKLTKDSTNIESARKENQLTHSDNSKAKILENPKSNDVLHVRSISSSRDMSSRISPRRRILGDFSAAVNNETSNAIPRSSSLHNQNRPTLRGRPRADHGSFTNIREKSQSMSRIQQHSKLSYSSGNLSPRALTLPKDSSLQNIDNQRIQSSSFQTSSVPPLPNGAREGRKLRRFGLPLDSKLLHNMLLRQEKCQPTKALIPEGGSKRRNSLKSISSKLLFLKDKVRGQEKENSFDTKQSCPMDMSNDEYGMARLLETGDKLDSAPDSDDEYGMTLLLDSSKTLTSTPVMAKRPMAAKHSFVSDEGYCPSHECSPPANRKRIHPRKISIRSDRSWISSDMEESDACSGEISPYSVTTMSATRFNFNGVPTSTPQRRKESRDNNRILSTRSRISPDWDSSSQKSSSVSLLSLSTDVPESCL